MSDNQLQQQHETIIGWRTGINKKINNWIISPSGRAELLNGNTEDINDKIMKFIHTLRLDYDFTTITIRELYEIQHLDQLILCTKYCRMEE